MGMRLAARLEDCRARGEHQPGDAGLGAVTDHQRPDRLDGDVGREQEKADRHQLLGTRFGRGGQALGGEPGLSLRDVSGRADLNAQVVDGAPSPCPTAKPPCQARTGLCFGAGRHHRPALPRRR